MHLSGRDEWHFHGPHGKLYQNNYLNCIRDCDTHVVRLMQTVRSLGLDEKTIVVMTADHGDHAGAHQVVDKGATTYAQQNHVPLVIRHPAYPGGKRCNALTSHLDIAPTLLGLPGRDAARLQTIGGNALISRNCSPSLSKKQSSSTLGSCFRLSIFAA